MDIKKIFSALLIVGFLMYGGLAVAGPGGGSIFGNLPQPTQQQTCHLNHDVTWLGDRYSGNPCDCRAGNDVDIEQCAACCVANTVMNIVQWTFYIMIILASFFLLVGAYHIMSAGGNPDKITLGRKYVMLAVIGGTIALLVFILPRVLMSLIF